MPQFILDTSGAVPANVANPITVWDNLDAFTQSYIEALFFTSTEPGTTREDFDPENGSSLPGDAAFDDFNPDSLGAIVDDCAAFQAANAADLSQAGDDTQNGHDYWLTRNHHGAGFWDRGYDGDVSTRLTDAAHAEGEIDAYFGDDGRIYL